jgi:hypothetical protein
MTCRGKEGLYSREGWVGVTGHVRPSLQKGRLPGSQLTLFSRPLIRGGYTGKIAGEDNVHAVGCVRALEGGGGQQGSSQWGTPQSGRWLAGGCCPGSSHSMCHSVRVCSLTSLGLRGGDGRSLDGERAGAQARLMSIYLGSSPDLGFCRLKKGGGV